MSPLITEDLPIRFWGHKTLLANGFVDSTEFEIIVKQKPLYVSNSYWTLMNHAGPHVDAPNHVIKGSNGVDQYELLSLFGPIKLLDFRNRSANEAVELSDITSLDFQVGDIVILLSGYVHPTESDEETPVYSYLSDKAAEYLASIPIKCFITDGLSVDSFVEVGKRLSNGAMGLKEVGPVHYYFLSNNIPVIEQIVNAETLLFKKNTYFVGFPLKVKDGDGSPLRAAAFVYE